MFLSALALAAAISNPQTAVNAPISTDPLNTLALAEALVCAPNDDACRQAEFSLRYEADQGVRRDETLRRLCPDLGGAGIDEACAEGLFGEIDARNTEAVRPMVRTGEWPNWSGKAARGVWLIVQHARTADGKFDTDFMVEALPFLLAGVQAGDLDPQDYARTADRALLDQGELQKFGTIRVCRGGAFDVATVDSENAVEANRRDLGFEISFAAARWFMDSQCHKEASQ